MTTKTTPEQARSIASRMIGSFEMAMALHSLANQVEALTASQNICGSGAGCLHKDATIEALTTEIEQRNAHWLESLNEWEAMVADRDAAMALADDRLVDAERIAFLQESDDFAICQWKRRDICDEAEWWGISTDVLDAARQAAKDSA